MKTLMQLRNFEEAKEVAIRNGYPVDSCSICNIQKDDIDWGYEVYVELDDLRDKYYIYHHFFIPSCCFKSITKSLDIDRVLRYGMILTDDKLFDRCDDRAAEVRIRLFSYKNIIYYVKMINGTVIEFKKVGVIR